MSCQLPAKRSPNAGVTLLETLLVLATIALIIGLTVRQTGFLRNLSSETASLQDIQTQIETHRRRAVGTAQEIRVHPSDILAANQSLCSPDALDIRFYTDGTVGSAPFCMMIEGRNQQINIDWISGHVSIAP